MPIRKFIPYHLLFCCIATGIIFWPSAGFMAYFSGCMYRCDEITAEGIAAGVVFGSIAGCAIYAVAFRLFFKNWPYMTTLAFGALIAGITIFFTLRAAALATVDGQHALAASIGILIVPGAWWVSTFCIRPLTLDGLQVT